MDMIHWHFGKEGMVCVMLVWVEMYVSGAGAGDGGVWEGDMHCSEVSLGKAVTLCLPALLHPKAAFSLFIPLQGKLSHNNKNVRRNTQIHTYTK